jgi:hypothetical protein
MAQNAVLKMRAKCAELNVDYAFIEGLIQWTSQLDVFQMVFNCIRGDGTNSDRTDKSMKIAQAASDGFSDVSATQTDPSGRLTIQDRLLLPLSGLIGTFYRKTSAISTSIAVNERKVGNIPNIAWSAPAPAPSVYRSRSQV